MLYEAVLLIALLFLATALFTAVFGDSRSRPNQLFLQLYLFLVAGAYFTWSWAHGRRTLPMRTWRIRLVERSGRPLRTHVALMRYVYAAIGIALGAVGVLWLAVDPEHQFLHDRLAGTRLVADANSA